MIKLKTSYIIILLLFLQGNNIFYMLKNNINYKLYFIILFFEYDSSLTIYDLVNQVILNSNLTILILFYRN